MLAVIRSWGVEQVEFIPTIMQSLSPVALKLPFMAGIMVILYGRR